PVRCSLAVLSYCYGARLYLHSFPTRRSSDLRVFSSNGSSASDGSISSVCSQVTPWCSHCLYGARVRLTRSTASLSSRSPRRRSIDRKSTRLNSSHVKISYAVFCLKKKMHKRH